MQKKDTPTPSDKKLTISEINAKIIEVRSEALSECEQSINRLKNKQENLSKQLAARNAELEKLSTVLKIEAPLTDVQVLGYAALAYCFAEMRSSLCNSLCNLKSINARSVDSTFGYRYSIHKANVVFHLHETFLRTLNAALAKSTLAALTNPEFVKNLPTNVLDVPDIYLTHCNKLHSYVDGTTHVKSVSISIAQNALAELRKTFQSIRLVLDEFGNYLYFEASFEAPDFSLSLMPMLEKRLSPDDDDDEDEEEEDEEDEEEEDIP